MSDKTLEPIEQKTVLFYDDEITAVRLEDGRVFIPVRPLVERLGVDWNGQRRRINRDAVLSEEVTSVDVTSTQGGAEQRRAMLCLPLDYVSGFLFGINADRVSPDVRDHLIRYQRECYKVLAEAFQDGRLTTDPDIDIEALLQQDSPAAQAYQMALAVVRMARQQVVMEAKLEQHGVQLGELYRKFSVNSYKLIPKRRFQEAMNFLNEWLQHHLSDEAF